MRFVHLHDANPPIPIECLLVICPPRTTFITPRYGIELLQSSYFCYYLTLCIVSTLFIHSDLLSGLCFGGNCATGSLRLRYLHQVHRSLLFVIDTLFVHPLDAHCAAQVDCLYVLRALSPSIHYVCTAASYCTYRKVRWR